MNKPEYIIVHHTSGTATDPKADTSHHTFEIVNEWHKQQWNFPSSYGHYIGYHYFINKDGKVKQGRSHTDTGAHTIGKNNSSIGICLAGNFDVTHPSTEQILALTRLLKRLMEELNIPASKIVPHRVFAKSKTCYGENLSDEWARSLVETKEPEMSIEEMEKLIVTLTAELEAIKKKLSNKKKGG